MNRILRVIIFFGICASGTLFSLTYMEDNITPLMQQKQQLEKECEALEATVRELKEFKVSQPSSFNETLFNLNKRLKEEVAPYGTKIDTKILNITESHEFNASTGKKAWIPKISARAVKITFSDRVVGIRVMKTLQKEFSIVVHEMSYMSGFKLAVVVQVFFA